MEERHLIRGMSNSKTPIYSRLGKLQRQTPIDPSRCIICFIINKWYPEGKVNRNWTEEMAKIINCCFTSLPFRINLYCILIGALIVLFVFKDVHNGHPRDIHVRRENNHNHNHHRLQKRAGNIVQVDDDGGSEPPLEYPPIVDFERASGGPVQRNKPEQVTSPLIKPLFVNRGRVDGKRVIRTFDGVWVGEKWDHIVNEDFSVCLTTQSSLDRVFWVPEQIRNWNGPLSLAVFVVSPEEWIGLNLLVHHYRKCYPLFKDFVTIHVGIPSEAADTWTNNLEDLSFHTLKKQNVTITQFLEQFSTMACKDDGGKEMLDLIMTHFHADDIDKEKFMINYPQNHMRNLARQGCPTEWTYSVDVDIIPTPNQASDIQDFLLHDEVQECQKCAYVIPTFELDKKLPFPANKKELVKHWQDGKARPFHFLLFQKGHNATDYKKWSHTFLEDTNQVKVSHNVGTSVAKLVEFYEPFYLSRNKIPLFQERFIGYGFTRSSQIQEALAEGWTFKVLTPIFGIHWSLQNSHTLLNPGNDKALRKQQTYFNGRVMNRFKQELQLRKKLKPEEEKDLKSWTAPSLLSEY